MSTVVLNTADLTPWPRDAKWQIPACVSRGMGRLWGYQVTFDHQTLEPFLPAREWITARPSWWLGAAQASGDGAAPVPLGLPFTGGHVSSPQTHTHAGQDVGWDRALGGVEGAVCDSR